VRISDAEYGIAGYSGFGFPFSAPLKGFPMKRFLFAVAALLSIACLAELPQAAAQPQVPGGGGSGAGGARFSPYLNLLGGNRSPGLNYLGLVRPQQQLNQQFGQLQQQLTQQNQSLNQALQATEESLLPPTGNVAVFNSTGGYFNRIPGATSGGAFGTAGGFGRSGGAFGGAGGVGNQPSFSRPQSSRGGGRR